MKKKNIKYLILSVVAIIIIFLLFLIYNNLFADSNNPRNDDISEYKVSSQEIDSVKAKFTQLEEVESVNISTLDDVKSRRLSIVVTLNSDVDFDSMKKISNEALLGFSEKNLNYYDIHITIDSKNDESDIYPKMGTRVKPSEGETNLEFVWSR